MTGLKDSLDAVRRKLRAVAAVARDAGATEHERAAAKALKTRLERKLKEAGAPAGDWTDNVFRLGKWARQVGKSAPAAPPADDWAGTAHRLGKAVRRGYKRWLSE